MTENFHNAAHYDNDASDVTYGIWAPWNKLGPFSSRRMGLQSVMGCFMLHLKNQIYFAAVDDVVELIWKAATDAYSTIGGTVSEGFETWGSSRHTSMYLMQCITKALKYVSDVVDIKIKEN